MLLLNEYRKLITAARKHNVATCLWGDPGSGKTEFSKEFAKQNDCHFLHINCAQLESTDIALPEIVEEIRNDKRDKFVKYIACGWLKDLVLASNSGRQIVILLDEINRIKSENENLLTTFVLEKILYEYHFPNAFFLAAANYPSRSDKTADLDDAIMHRFCHIPFEPSAADVIPYTGDETVQEFFRKNPDLLEMDSRIDTFASDVMGRLGKNRRSSPMAARILASGDLAGVSNAERMICQGLIGEVEGGKIYNLYMEFRNDKDRMVPATLKGNFERCGELLDEGMVGEIAELCKLHWRTNDKELVTEFMFKHGIPALHVAVAEWSKKEDDVEMFETYRVPDELVDRLVFTKDGKITKGSNIPTTHRQVIHLAMLYTNLKDGSNGDLEANDLKKKEGNQ